MPITPAVIEAANAFRARLLARERAASTAMVRYYGASWTRIRADIDALSAEVQAMRLAGQEPERRDIISLERMRAIETQVEREMVRFADYADIEITARQREAIASGERDAYELMRLSLPSDTGVRVNMYRMPREAVENYVGMMQDGTPLRELLGRYVGDAAQNLSETLVTGMVAGHNPRKVAREVRDAYGMALSDAMRLARTEQLRAYRTANLQSYNANSDVVTSWRRLCAKLPNSCMACVMLDGKIYTLGEPMDDHPNGKCVMLPVTKTYAELGIDAPEPTYSPESARDWFERQTPATQRDMMGAGMFDAWKDGRFALEDIPMRVENATWGNHWTPKPLYRLLGVAAPVGSYTEWVAQQEAVTV